MHLTVDVKVQTIMNKLRSVGWLSACKIFYFITLHVVHLADMQSIQISVAQKICNFMPKDTIIDNNLGAKS